MGNPAVAGIDHPDNVRFRQKHIAKFIGVGKTIAGGYMKIARRHGYVAANQALLSANKRLKRGDLNLSWDDDQITPWCEAKAKQCSKYVYNYDERLAERRIRELLAVYDMDFPEQNIDLFGIESAFQRCQDERWWRRQVRRIQAREVDELARAWRLVHEKGQVYCSDDTLERRREQKTRNRKLLKQMQATNDIGQEYTLDELSDLGVSNPDNKRAELMVRMRGFEELAQATGRVGEFYTITCPSKYHAIYKKSGIPNAKWNGSTVREAHSYLVHLWGLIRADLHRNGITVFGFRVVEPHHDGCPHWHLLLFVEPEQRFTCRRIVKGYSEREDKAEIKKDGDRFKAIGIDPAKGTAAGYIAKYVSKNIDGYRLADDGLGKCAKSSAERIEAWAACHGIRQFQQIGGASVTVWRELRRLRDRECEGVMEKCRKAADGADWCAFNMLMGSGRNQALQIIRANQIDTETGELMRRTNRLANQYGEPVTGRIIGLIGHGCSVITRFWEWTIKHISKVLPDCRGVPKPGFNLYEPGFGISSA